MSPPRLFRQPLRRVARESLERLQRSLAGITRNSDVPALKVIKRRPVIVGICTSSDRLPLANADKEIVDAHNSPIISLHMPCSCSAILKPGSGGEGKVRRPEALPLEGSRKAIRSLDDIALQDPRAHASFFACRLLLSCDLVLRLAIASLRVQLLFMCLLETRSAEGR